MKSFIPVDKNSHFPIQNLPYSAFKAENGDIHLCSRIGDYLIDLFVLDQAGLFDGEILSGVSSFRNSSLNHFLGLGKPAWVEARHTLQHLLRNNTPRLRDNKKLCSQVFIPVEKVELVLPVRIGDYTDFYSSEQHARNVGSLFRDPENALLPNWKHIPVGYHGRASSIILSGTNIHRPKGQIQDANGKPVYSESKRVDFELEVGFITGLGNNLGQSVSIETAEDHIFGLVLVNDWSARDIQKWEYQPLGPFLAKSWATSISPWIVTTQALSPFRVKAPEQQPKPLSYLQQKPRETFNITLEVHIITKNMTSPEKITQTNYRKLYWTMAQQLAHQTINGCNIRPGDLYASGTISGDDKNEYGSLLEITRNGSNPISLPGGEKRTFLQDGDTVIMTGYARNENCTIGFGELRNTLLPSKS